MNIEIYLPEIEKPILVSESKFDRIMELVNIKFTLLRDSGIQFWKDNKKWTLAGYILNNLDKTLCVDHKNHNQFDYTDDNLRLGTYQQNSSNRLKHKTFYGQKPTSKYKGVCWHKDVGKWVAKITVKYKTIHLGYFSEEVDAAKAYNEAALQHHGDFAHLNILPDGK